MLGIDFSGVRKGFAWTVFRTISTIDLSLDDAFCSDLRFFSIICSREVKSQRSVDLRCNHPHIYQGTGVYRSTIVRIHFIHRGRWNTRITPLHPFSGFTKGRARPCGSRYWVGFLFPPSSHPPYTRSCTRSDNDHCSRSRVSHRALFLNDRLQLRQWQPVWESRIPGEAWESDSLRKHSLTQLSIE